MPDIPDRHTDPASIQREKAAKANSRLYWCHESVTVWQYLRMSRAEQDQVNAECRAIERGRAEQAN